MQSNVSIEYDLAKVTSKIENIINNPSKDDIEKDMEYTYKQWLHNDKVYNIIKYNKNVSDFKEENGLFRSVIFSNGEINVFSPPKSIKYNDFISRYQVNQCYGEEIVEGTMVNVFYDKNTQLWTIATKTSVGGKLRYFQDQDNFDVLFEQVCNGLGLDLNTLDNQYTYSFVMQHPNNRFVLPINHMRLYLIAVYKIDGMVINEIPREKYHELNLDHFFQKIWFPYRFLIDSYENLYNNFASMNCDINCVGTMVKTHTGVRTKIVNPAYKYIKDLRGNNSKLQFQYLCLRRDDRVKEYLKFYPESSKKFNDFRKHVHNFTQNLYENYISCYVKHEKPLMEFSQKFRTHMYNLHQHYLAIKENKGYIHKHAVIEYVNKLEPSLLMYSLNYDLRELGKKYLEQPVIMQLN